MIVVTVQLHSAVTGKVSTLGQMIISNDGTGSAVRGNYDVRLGRRGAATLEAVYNAPVRRARVESFPRKSYTAWELVRRALRGLYGPAGQAAVQEDDE